MPTDTICGIIASALKRETVERLYLLRRQEPAKPFIILISNLEQLSKFKIKLSVKQQSRLADWWPGAISVILDCPDQTFTYLHRGTKSLAFRLPAPVWLQKLLSQTGPVVAPSANLAGGAPAQTIKQAQAIFGKQIDLYYEPTDFSPTLAPKPSSLVKLELDGTYEIRRRGAGDDKLVI